jgi:hypothetical protein
MLNLKKTALAVIALGSTAAFAGTMGPVCSAVNVTVPCENTAWDIGGRALYMQPTSNTGYGVATVVQNTSSLTTGANPAWGWGFQLEGSYHYSTGNDFNLNWYHFRSGGQTHTLAAPVVFPNVSGNLFGTTGPVTVDAAQTSASPAWDQVNMEFGQHVDFGENKFARFHGGMNFSRVGNSGFNYLKFTDSASPVVVVNQTNTRSSVYNGFGPRVGMDLNYEWGNGVGVYATGALSVLAGSSKASSQVTDWTTAEDNYVSSISQSKVVPELDAKLGAMYTYAMAQGDLSFDIGWMWAHYTNALFASDFSAGQALSESSDFGIQGLYFGMKWIGNVA